MCEALGEPLDQVLAVVGAFATSLLHLDNLAADRPVREHHRGVHSASDMRSRPLKDRGHSLEELLFVEGIALRHDGLCTPPTCSARASAQEFDVEF